MKAIRDTRVYVLVLAVVVFLAVVAYITFVVSQKAPKPSVLRNHTITIELNKITDKNLQSNIVTFFQHQSFDTVDGFAGGMLIEPGQVISVNDYFGPYDAEHGMVYAQGNYPDGLIGYGVGEAASGLACIAKAAGAGVTTSMYTAMWQGLPSECPAYTLWPDHPKGDITIRNNTQKTVTIHYRYVWDARTITLWVTTP